MIRMRSFIWKRKEFASFPPGLVGHTNASTKSPDDQTEKGPGPYDPDPELFLEPTSGLEPLT